MTERTVRPLASAGFEVFFANRWPGMAPGTTFSEVADVHADAILRHFGGPVDVIGHSTGGSLVLQLIADRPDVVRRAVAGVRPTDSGRSRSAHSFRCCEISRRSAICAGARSPTVSRGSSGNGGSGP